MTLMKLFLLHYAGGSSYFYHTWIKKFDDLIKVILIDLPGHGRRIKEHLLLDYVDVYEDIKENMQKHLKAEEGYAIFGHSMGGLLAYSLADHLWKEGFTNLKHLFISGCESPDFKRFEGKETRFLSEEELIQRILNISRIDYDIINSKEFMSIFLPIIKADFIALDTFQLEEPLHQLNCNITLINGCEDNRITEDRIMWERFTKGIVDKYTFEGDHFYLADNDARDKVCRIINEKLMLLI